MNIAVNSPGIFSLFRAGCSSNFIKHNYLLLICYCICHRYLSKKAKSAPQPLQQGKEKADAKKKRNTAFLLYFPYQIILLVAGLECFSARKIHIKRRFLRFLRFITNKLQAFVT